MRPGRDEDMRKCPLCGKRLWPTYRGPGYSIATGRVLRHYVPIAIGASVHTPCRGEGRKPLTAG